MQIATAPASPILLMPTLTSDCVCHPPQRAQAGVCEQALAQSLRAGLPDGVAGQTAVTKELTDLHELLQG
jgi:hypothetical protein